MIHLTEAVARRAGKYAKFPKTNSKEAILDFLDRMGFVHIEYNLSMRKDLNMMMVEYTTRTGKPCYRVGDYDDSLETHWIRICCDGKTIYDIYTDEAINPKTGLVGQHSYGLHPFTKTNDRYFVTDTPIDTFEGIGSEIENSLN